MAALLPESPRLVAEQCFCLGLKRAARAVARRYDQGLRPLDLNSGQFAMLTAIAGLEPVGIQLLADTLAMDRTTVTAALKPLQRRGLVEVAVSAADPRGRDASLSSAGRALLARAMPLWHRLQRDVAELLPPPAANGLQRQLSLLG